jgi:hypothetical protein
MHFPQKFQKIISPLRDQKTNTVDIRYSQRALNRPTMLTQKSKKTNYFFQRPNHSFVDLQGRRRVVLD